ncbi:MAG TPA: hypothetical protein VHM64_22070, partial [Candidatus Binatia bacterium]|nr:hypothetical protein [Candidatus Binatia bacterium]
FLAQALGSSMISLPSGAPEEWSNVVTGEKVLASSGGQSRCLALGTLFAHFPVALLAGQSAPASSLRAEPEIAEEVQSGLL